MPGYKTTQPPLIDGKVDPSEWPDSVRRTGFSDMGTNLASDEVGEFWLMYDEEYIYFAGRAKTDPRKIVDDEYRQNVGVSGNDNFRLYVDPTGDFSNINSFATNAAGATSIELSGGRALKTEWLGEIEANGRRTESGWECEMRIPWSTMSLPAAGTRTLRFNVWWYRSNKSNTYIWHFLNNDDSQSPYWTDVEVPVVAKGRSIKVLPFGTGSLEEGGASGFDSGFDLKTDLTSQIVAVGTVNPDFRNIENSILSLDFSRFERLANENRPFFQEGNDFRRTGSLFAPQRISQFEAGMNIYGALDAKTQFALLTTADFGEQQATVLSANHRLNPNRSVTFGYVRNDQPGLSSNSGLLSYSDRLGDFQIFGQGQFTGDEVEGSGERLGLNVSYSKEGTNAELNFNNVSSNFLPRLGFAPERDFRSYSAQFGREVTPASGSINQLGYYLYGQTATRIDGGFYRDSIGAGTEVSLTNGLGLELDAQFSKFESSVDHTYSFELDYPNGNPYRRISFEYTTGQYEGVDYQSIEFGWRYRPIRRMQVNLRSQFVDYEDFERQHVFSLTYDVGKYESFGGRLVEENGRTNWYVSYRLSGRRGAEYFLIVGDPRADSFANRVAFKMVLPLEIRY